MMTSRPTDHFIIDWNDALVILRIKQLRTNVMQRTVQPVEELEAPDYIERGLWCEGRIKVRPVGCCAKGVCQPFSGCEDMI